MRWLPSENLLDIFGFLPEDCLLHSISLVSRRFRWLSESALAQFHPMVAKIVHITWDPKKASHQLFVQSVKCAGSTSIRQSNQMPTNFPASAPPLNIVLIQRIRVEGKLSREVLEFLSQCVVKISQCELDFENLESFFNELVHQKMNLHEFFAVFGSRCSSLWLDGRFSSLCPLDFLRNISVLRCSSLSILRPFSAFDAQSVQNWLNWPSADGRRKHLTIIGNDNGKGNANESVEHLVELLADHQCGNVKCSRFTLELHNFCMERMRQFEDVQLSFRMINAQFWVLNSKTQDGGIDSDTMGRNANIGTFVDIGTFDH